MQEKPQHLSSFMNENKMQKLEKGGKRRRMLRGKI
jgi:hypothetical protein